VFKHCVNAQGRPPHSLRLKKGQKGKKRTSAAVSNLCQVCNSGQGGAKEQKRNSAEEDLRTERQEDRRKKSLKKKERKGFENEDKKKLRLKIGKGSKGCQYTSSRGD